MADTLFDKVLKNVDIVDVVSKYVKLEPKGANLFGLCPFHNDNHPSMSVSKEKGIFYCFTCHTGGNAIKFIEKYKNLSSLDAALFLAKEYSIDISNEYQKNRNKNDVFYDILKESQDFFRIIMNNESYSAKAREYLYSRGINDSIINEFSIGLAPKDKNALTLMMLEKGYLESNLVEAGMSSNGLDIFKDRITIPIKDEQGKIIAFGARIYEKQDTAKYINSKETPIFSKSNVLFNLNNAIKYIKEKNRAILYEGYMDVIASYKTSIKEAVASMGTALTNEQAKLLHKYTSNCILAYDGDEAGFNAMNSAINILEKNGFIVKIALFNDKLDPDEYITKYGIQAFEDLINNKTVSKILNNLKLKFLK